nr:hypothetical protein [Tanacetum cinerariifolium]
MTRSSTKELITLFENPERVFRSNMRRFETPGLVNSRSPEFNLFSNTFRRKRNFRNYNGNNGAISEQDPNFMKILLAVQNLKMQKVLEIVDLFHVPEEVILFYNRLDVLTKQILDSKGAVPTKTAADVKVVIQEMAEYSQKWHNGTSSKTKSTETFDGLVAIQAQLNSLGREIKKVNDKVYASQVECELCKGPHYTKDCLLKEEGKTLEKAYYK